MKVLNMKIIVIRLALCVAEYNSRVRSNAPLYAEVSIFFKLHCFCSLDFNEEIWELLIIALQLPLYLKPITGPELK